LTKQDFNGRSFQDLAEEFLMKRIEEESMTPEQRSQRDRDAELKKYKDAEACTAKGRRRPKKPNS
jgi:hypothetical protein